MFEFLTSKGFVAQKPPAQADAAPATAAPASGSSWWSTTLAAAELGFTLILHKTPGQAAAETVEPVLTIYGPNGMLDKGVQKAVDWAMGVAKPDSAYATPAEHAAWLGAIVSVGAMLFPELKVDPSAFRMPPMPRGLRMPPIGPQVELVTAEGIVVRTTEGAVSKDAARAASAEAAALSKTGGVADKVPRLGSREPTEPTGGGPSCAAEDPRRRRRAAPPAHCRWACPCASSGIRSSRRSLGAC